MVSASKIIFNLIVVICGIIGLIFSIVGLGRFPYQKLLFIITALGCLIGVLIGFVDLFKNKTDLSNDLFRLILSISSGMVLILASIYIIFFTSSSLFIKSISIIAIIFFSIAVAKGVVMLKK